jgi:hypothetical protein
MDFRLRVVEGREAAVAAGDDTLASHHLGVSHQALGHEFRVFDKTPHPCRKSFVVVRLAALFRLHERDQIRRARQTPDEGGQNPFSAPLHRPSPRPPAN